MLQIDKRRDLEDYPATDYGMADLESASPGALIERVIGVVRRQFAAIAFVSALTIALGVLYLFVTPPTFTAEATIFIDRGKAQFIQQQELFADAPIDSAAIESEIQILRSDNIARSVIKNLHLIESPEFGTPSRIAKLLGSIAHLFHPSQQTSEDDATQGAAYVFHSRLDAQRIGGSFIIAVTYKSHDATRAAQIANATVDAYMNYKMQAKFEETHRANVWLQDRVRELAEQSAAADQAVSDFAAKNNLATATTGKSINEQQISSLNAQLLDAQAQTSTAQARLDQIEGILTKDGELDDTTTFAAVADALTNPIIVQLRTKYLELVNRAADWSKRLGPDHLAVVNLRTQIHEIRDSIFDELRQIAETDRSDLAIAKQRQASIESELKNSVSQSAADSQAQSVLANLATAAKSRRSLYDELQQQFTQSLPSESFSVSDVQLITSASVPLEKSSPKTLLVLAIAAFGGLILGGGIGLLREMLDRVFRTSQQVEDALQTACIALVPAAKIDNEGTSNSLKNLLEEVSNFSSAGPRNIIRKPSVIWTVSEAPFSRFAEAIRSLKLAVDLSRMDQRHGVLGFTSAIPNEGKTTIAASLALLVAQVGGRVIAVDCDLRNPSLSRTLTPNAKCGLLEVISGKSSLEDAVWVDPSTKMAFLPAYIPFRLPNSSEILNNELTVRLFEKLRQSYDYVVVDLPPLVPVVDVRATRRLVDTYVLVVEWGRTKIPLIKHALGEASGVHKNLLGVVLNKADIDTVRRYDGYLGDYYHNKHFSRYGYVD
jgi:succinoglycan biosynthesis transport protein ExoP